MPVITWRKSSKRANHVVGEDQLALQPSELGATTTGVESVQEAESSGKFGWEDAKQSKPRTTWVWDRSKQAWVEICEKPTMEELPSANGPADMGIIAPPQPSATPASVTRKIGWLKSARELFPTKASMVHVSDEVVLKSKTQELSGPEAAVRRPADKEATGIILDTRQEAEESARTIIRRNGEQAQNTLSRPSDKAKEIKEKVERQAPAARQEARKSSPDRFAGAEQLAQGIIKAAEAKARAHAEKVIGQVEEKAEARAEVIIARADEKAKAQAEKIIRQVEEKAEARAEVIIARADEKAKAQAEKIIRQVEEKAEARAEVIIARAEERTRAQIEKIIAQAEEKAEARADNIIARVEDKARALAGKIIAQAENICQQRGSAAEQRAQRIFKTTDEKATEIKASAETTVKAMPGQPAPSREGNDRKEKPATSEGTAELVIGPTVDVGKMQKMLTRLTKFPEIRVLDLGGSAGKGVTIKLFSGNLARLPNRLEALPEVAKVSELPRKLSKICYSQRICPGPRSGNGPPVRRLLVTLEKQTTYLEI